MSVDTVVFGSASDLARRIRTREVSARDVMASFLARIAALNPTINAVVSARDDDACLAEADASDRAIRADATVGALHGLPIAIKDLEPAAGLRWTRGSLAYERDVAAGDSAIVTRLRRAGAIVIGKTNVPEFGMGSHTYNKVYGTTLNPWNLTKTAGGSSGGAAAAIAAGMLPLADGSDFGGSLRNPANFTNIVGMRPSFGLVPDDPNPLPGVGFGVKGPLARTVGDAALLLSVLADRDFTAAAENGLAADTRIAWSPDLGSLPVDPEVRAIVDAQRSTFVSLGCIVDDAHPDFSGVDDFFMTIRQARSWRTLGPLLAGHRAAIKPEAVWEIESGARITDAELAIAQQRHREFLDRMRRFHDRYDFVVCVVNQVPPFDASADWPHDIAGVTMDHYISWMKSAYWISATYGPAISVPAGFTRDGLPVGLQIAGARGNDAGVLAIARAFESATRVGDRRPALNA
ncbi:MAG TPA: amidase family protein [Vicinamibacterales bacterium]|nr:amidase family protein [Vicinamibacterales bacterium]